MSFKDFNFAPVNGLPTFHFCLLSQAYFVDTDWGFGAPIEGVKKMGALGHKHHIPVTYFVTGRSAEEMADTLTQYHEEFGDEVQEQLRFTLPGSTHKSERESVEIASVKQFLDHIRQDRARILKALPWAEPTLTVMGSGIRSENLIQALQQLGYTGIHGHCPFQLGVDQIITFSAPWSSFYVGADNYQCPATPEKSKNALVGLEWTARDLCKSWHYVATEIYSTDPNDVERGGICTDTNVEYWKELTKEWLRNVPLNGDIFFQMHQESHEMDGRHEICHPFTPERVEFTYKMMDLYFDWLTSLPESISHGNSKTGIRIAFETASQHIDRYKQRSIYTPPAIMAYREISVPKNLPYWDQIRAGKGYCGYPSKHARMPSEGFYNYIQSAINLHHFDGAPWTDSLCYYDTECMLLFDDSGTRSAPIWAANYNRARTRPNVPTEGIVAVPLSKDDGENIEWFQEENLPEPDITWDKKKHTAVITVKSDRNVPWGAAWWNLQSWKAKKATILTPKSAPARAWLVDHKILFLRANLTSGEHSFVVELR